MDNNGIRSIDPVYESMYKRGDKQWSSDTLREFARQEGYQVFDMPLKAIDISREPFKIRNLKDFIYHAKRLKNVNFNIPIILDDNGTVADGNHHIVKAFLEGKDYVKAIRLLKMPESDIEI